MRLALVLPPSTQLNTPYPSISYLGRAMQDAGIDVHQDDLGLRLALHLFSRAGLAEVLGAIEDRAEAGLPGPAWDALARGELLLETIDTVVAFLQGRDPTAATRLARQGSLPAGPRLARAEAMDLDHHFGRMGKVDRARYRASLHLADLAELVQATLDPGFSLAHYQHHLAAGPSPWAPIAARLAQSTLVDGWLDALCDELLERSRPDVVGLSVPFPGTLYGALRLGQRLRERGVYVVMGGGYVNTELREVDEAGLWGCVDALSYDDGEGPLLAILEHLAGGPDRRHRTRSAQGRHDATVPTRPFNPAPDYGDLPLGDYLGILDSLSPAHRLWSEARWNKLTVAHGCYWKKCAFCDIQLDYIARYEPAPVTALVDHIERLVDQTGVRGFHLVDEAAPPRVLRDLAVEILARGLDVSFWGNVRFEAAFTPALCRLLARAGMTMVTGGLEVATDGMLARMQKGVTVDQAARAAHAFTEAGILVHAYLMYGFPGQSAQDTVESMEVVRQLFAAGVLQSAFWHRFVLTRHSGVAADPARWGVHVPPLPADTFAANDLPHEDRTGHDPTPFDGPLVASLQAWMRGEGHERPVLDWLEGVPGLEPPRTASDRVALALEAESDERAWRDRSRVLWLGQGYLESDDAVTVLGTHHRSVLRGPPAVLEWLGEVLDAAHPAEPPLRWAEVRESFPGDWSRWQRQWARVRAAGLVAV